MTTTTYISLAPLMDVNNDWMTYIWITTLPSTGTGNCS